MVLGKISFGSFILGHYNLIENLLTGLWARRKLCFFVRKLYAQNLRRDMPVETPIPYNEPKPESPYPTAGNSGDSPVNGNGTPDTSGDDTLE